MKKYCLHIKTILLTCLLAWLCGGCDETIQPQTETEGSRLCTIHLNTAPSLAVETRATTIDEDDIKDLWVIQIENGTIGALQYLESNELINEANGSKSARIEMIKTSGNPSIVFIANSGENGLFYPAEIGRKAFQLITAKITNFKKDWKERLSEKGCIPMSAIWEGDSPGPVSEISVTLTRAMAQVSISLDKAIPADDVLIIDSIKLKNVPQSLQYWREDLSTPPAPSGGFYLYWGNYPADEYPSLPKDYIFWMPENLQGTGSESSPTQKDGTSLSSEKNPTYLEIKGMYNGDDVTYTFYLGENAVNDYNVKRNTKYNVHLTIIGRNTMDARVKLVKNELAVGDVLCLDNNTFYAIKQEKYNRNINKAVGLVFYVGQHASDNIADYEGKLDAISGYAMALTTTEGAKIFSWQDNATKSPSPNVTTDITDFKGYYNTQQMKKFTERESKALPAYNSAVTYNTTLPLPDNKNNNSGWYLPSAGQLVAIYESPLISSEIIRKLFGDKVYLEKNNSFWSSTKETNIWAYVVQLFEDKKSITAIPMSNEYHFVIPAVTFKLAD